MNGAFYIGATGLRSQQSALDVIANNIANINTPAFKRSEVRFAELLAPRGEVDLTAPTSPDLATLMAGVSARASAKIFTQGELRQTGKALDVAIDGQGFIEVLGSDGETLLWRGGAMKVDAEGRLSAANGMPLRAMITAPEGMAELAITPDGRVTARIEGEKAFTEIGRIDLVLAKDVDALSALGDGLYKAETPDALIQAMVGESGAGRLAQGFIENSNVQLSDEMVTLLLMQRAYAANAQVLQAGDQLMGIANGLKR